MEPIFTVEALDHEVVYQLRRMWLFAGAVDIKEGHVVDILVVLVSFSLESCRCLVF